jgi:hypothetical protein
MAEVIIREVIRAEHTREDGLAKAARERGRKQEAMRWA